MNPTSRDVHIPGIMGQPKRKPVQKPWSVSNVPPSLKNFTDAEKATFASVANKVLAQTKDEGKAMAAGLHAVNLMRGKVAKIRHSKSTCMVCKDRPPTRDILWNHGKSRAWLCDSCFNKWNGEHGASVVRMAYISGGTAPARHRKVKQSPKVTKDGEKVVKEWEATIIAKAQDKQLAYGLILRPNVADSQGDTYDDEEVEKAAHWYAANSLGKADWLHEAELPRGEAVLVESFVAPTSFDWNGFEVRKGDWLGAMWIRDKDKWEAVKKGEIQAFSIKGQGRRMAL